MDAVDRAREDWERERPDLDPAPIAVFGRLTRASELARRRLEAFLRPFHLNPKTFDVLANLRRGGSPYRKTPSELADSALISSGALTGRLNELERLGLIQRAPHPTDRRIMFAELTADGVALIDRVFEAHLADEHKILASLNTTQRDRIAESLATLEELLQSVLGQR